MATIEEIERHDAEIRASEATALRNLAAMSRRRASGPRRNGDSSSSTPAGLSRRLW